MLIMKSPFKLATLLNTHVISRLPFSICVSRHLHLLHAFPRLLLRPSLQSPKRAVLLKMAVQRRAADHHPPRPGSACSLKRSPLVEAELSEARPASACARHSALPHKWAEKVKRKENRGWIVS